MAEFVLKKMIEKEGREGEFYVASAATSSEEIWNGRGNPVYPPAKEELRRHGISCEGKRAVQLIPADYDEYDLIIGMDGANIRNMHRLFGGDPKGKIKKLLDYADGGDISDPWYSGDFETTYKDVCKGCEGLIKSI
jgi:protein-tyrosine phosphatase